VPIEVSPVELVLEVPPDPELTDAADAVL
jgi:hypothetical protein